MPWISTATVAGTLAFSMFVSGCATPSSSGSVHSGRQTRQEQTVRMGVVESVRQVTIEGTQGTVGTVAGGAIGSGVTRVPRSLIGTGQSLTCVR